MTPIISIRGLQEAQRGNLKMIATMKTGGALEEAVRIGTIAAHRYSVYLTHVDTGALRISHKIKMRRSLFSGPSGEVYIDPSNPGITRRRGRRRTAAIAARPSEYGPIEHARGGEHAFYKRAVEQHGGSIARQAIAAFVSRIPK